MTTFEYAEFRFFILIAVRAHTKCRNVKTTVHTSWANTSWVIHDVDTDSTDPALLSLKTITANFPVFLSAAKNSPSGAEVHRGKNSASRF